MIQRTVGPESFGTTLSIGVGNNRPDRPKRLLIIRIGEFERTVFKIDLKPGTGVFATRPAEKEPPVIVVRQSPLPVGATRQRIDGDNTLRVAETDRVNRDVEPVVQVPVQPAALMFQIARCLAVYVVNLLFGIGHAIPVGVLITPQVVGVGLVDDQFVTHAQHHPGQEQFIDENRTFVHLPIAVGVFQQQDAAYGVVLTGSFGILHVGVHFGHVHPGIAIPGNGHGFVNQGFAGNQLHVIPLRNPEGVQTLVGR